MADITLTPGERAVLQQVVQGTRDPHSLKRAQALLWLDAGDPLTAVARRLLVSRQTVYNWIAM